MQENNLLENFDQIANEAVAHFFDRTISDSEFVSAIKIFIDSNIQKSTIADLLYLKIFCKENTLAIAEFKKRNFREHVSIEDGVLDVLMTKLCELDEKRSPHISSLASIQAYFSMPLPVTVDIPKLPEICLEYGAYVDLASGPDYWNYFNQFKGGISYYAVDSSFFVCEILKMKAKLLGIKNFKTINKRIDLVERCDIAEPIIALRLKNVRSYVENQEEATDKFFEWLSPGAKVAIQDYASVYDVNSFNYNQRIMISKLESYERTFTQGDKNNRFGVHTYEFIKKTPDKID